MKINILYIILFCIFVQSTFAIPFYVAKYKGDKSCSVSFTFDDGLQEHYTLVYPELEKRGFKGTFWIVGNLIENENANLGKPRMTWAQMREMSQHGHEISNHSWTHPNFCKLILEQMKVEIFKTDSAIFHNIGVKSLTFCYPGNYLNNEVIQVASENKVGTRTYQYSIGGEKAQSIPDSLSAWLQRLISSREWGVTMTHGITYGYDFFENPNILWDFFSEVKTREDSIWVATFAEVAAYKKECDNTTFDIRQNGKTWLITPHCSLDKTIFTEWLTAVIPLSGIKKISVKQNGKSLTTTILQDKVMFGFDPFGSEIEIQTDYKCK
jgi:peptidoglycan/xylan/chitin deacetylase (PgdA/CDA1 family)